MLKTRGQRSENGSPNGLENDPPPPARTPARAASAFLLGFFALAADERALRVPWGCDGVEHRGPGIEAAAEGVLFRLRIPWAVHVHPLRVPLLLLQVLRAAQRNPLPQVFFVTCNISCMCGPQSYDVRKISYFSEYGGTFVCACPVTSILRTLVALRLMSVHFWSRGQVWGWLL